MPQPLQSGQLLAGRYCIVVELGAGGMGRVYRAQDQKLERQVAIKLLSTVDNPKRIERFTREARAIARLNHPNIVTVHDTDSFEGTPFIVMELLDGSTLADTSLESPASVVELLVQLADALAEAHQRGIVHRDVKPQNIQVLPDGRPKLLDFGLAILEEEQRLTSSGELPGTFLYMSPEQAAGESVDQRTDQYSLALVGFELLSGTFPHPTGRVGRTLYSRLHRTPTSLGALNETLPLELVQSIDRALSRDPDQRFDTIGEFAETLRNSLPALRNSLFVERAHPSKPSRSELPRPGRPALEPINEQADPTRTSGSRDTASQTAALPRRPAQPGSATDPADPPRMRESAATLTGERIQRSFSYALGGLALLAVLALALGWYWKSTTRASEQTTVHSVERSDPVPTPTKEQPDPIPDPGPLRKRDPRPDPKPVKKPSPVWILIRPVVRTLRGLEPVAGLTVSVNGTRIGISEKNRPLRAKLPAGKPARITVSGVILKRPGVRRLDAKEVTHNRTIQLEVDLKW